MRILFVGAILGHIPGTGQKPKKCDNPLLISAAELGYSAVNNGHTALIRSESKNSIDYYVFQGICRFCEENKDRTAYLELHQPEGRILPYSNIPNNLKFSRVVYPKTPKAPYYQHTYIHYEWIVATVRALDSTDVVIVSGDGQSIKIIGTIASERKIPVLAIASFGGLSKTLYEDLKYVYNYIFPDSTDLSYLYEPWTPNSSDKIIALAELAKKDLSSNITHSYFISYSSEDTDIADHIEALLRRFNRIVRRDEENIKGGTSLTHSIAFLIDESDTFIGVLSKNYNNSVWCKNELEYARENQKQCKKPTRIVILQTDETKPIITFCDARRFPAKDRIARELAIRRLMEEED